MSSPINLTSNFQQVQFWPIRNVLANNFDQSHSFRRILRLRSYILSKKRLDLLHNPDIYPCNPHCAAFMGQFLRQPAFCARQVRTTTSEFDSGCGRLFYRLFYLFQGIVGHHNGSDDDHLDGSHKLKLAKSVQHQSPGYLLRHLLSLRLWCPGRVRTRLLLQQASLHHFQKHCDGLQDCQTGHHALRLLRDVSRVRNGQSIDSFTIFIMDEHVANRSTVRYLQKLIYLGL